MHTLNHDIDDCFLDADGAYLDARGLQSLERYAQTYANRLEAYNNLREYSPKLVDQVLNKMAQAQPELMQKHQQRCRYDMTEVLRYTTLAILRDDEIFFREVMTSWLDTVLMAYKRHDHCAGAYRMVQEAIDQHIPASSSIIRPYLDVVILALQSHV